MMKRFSRKTRNRVLIVMACAAVLVLAVWGTVSAFRTVMGERAPAKAANADLPPAVASVPGVSSTPSGIQSLVPPASSSAVSVPPASSQSAASLPTEKTVYLTFDDGPSSLTGPLLDVLDHYKVKATFFVVGVNDKNETRDLQEIVRRGHAIGVHSWSHNYRQIYASSDAFFADYDRIHQAILDATGVDTKICRFAGGSVNGYDRKVRAAIFKELKRRGDVYFDWNASGGDAGGATTSDAICRNALKGVHAHRVSVVLFHNTAAKEATLRQIPKFISTLQGEGYRFDVLSPSIDNTSFIF